jgi:hypothetical protein
MHWMLSNVGMVKFDVLQGIRITTTTHPPLLFCIPESTPTCKFFVMEEYPCSPGQGCSLTAVLFGFIIQIHTTPTLVTDVFAEHAIHVLKICQALELLLYKSCLLRLQGMAFDNSST